ncbi:MAG: glycosyltransferase, partial [Nitrosomonas sp. PRO5]|nr:glycosyltransferase [Nitrosomonas sp. PRO5]
MAVLVMYLSLAGMLCWWAILLAPWRAWSTREQLEPSSSPEAKQSFDDVTVLIPARNEAQFIDQTLNRLQAQGEGLRIIVIDDQSEDHTASL